ncbi:SMI1 / KNR4 family (SUKH-1) [Thermomonospora echinospora]|uniref:SMI1 / KNR4 family (SUKH-1) n=1 Tax=Thermomonospora echinospora TaxID=1992 RepID=A0A1H6DAN1_9ACTN|nr:SMI1/KNR4 family protein [Thermomonospora echinospora]SEG82391.1 SMI1 / KNR4 family (SUKH-1) [Thermomonospora echinospora]
MVMVDWHEVRRRVRDLAASPLAAKVFGYHGHGFQLDPVLRPDELAELEQQIKVRLPDDYRDFLLHVGRGGAGPFYGVFPVERIDGRWQWVGDGADLTDLDRLDRPFPAEGLDPTVLEALRAEEPDEETFEDIESFDTAYEEWDRRYEAVVWNDARTVGALCLCHQGCALREWLVVSGPERGNIWTDHRVDDEDLSPHREGDLERTSFATWYLSWLKAAEAEVRS